MVSIGRLSSIGVLLFLNVYVYSSDNITKKNIVEIGSDGSRNVVDTFYPKKDGGDFKNDFDKDCEAVLNYLARKGSIFLGEEKMVNYIGEGYHINYLVTSKDSIDAFMNDSKFDNIPVLRYSKKCSFGDLKKELHNNGAYLFYKGRLSDGYFDISVSKGQKICSLGNFITKKIDDKEKPNIEDIKFFVYCMGDFVEKNGVYELKDDITEEIVANEIKKAISDYKAAQSSNTSNSGSSNNSSSGGGSSSPGKKKKCCC